MNRTRYTVIPRTLIFVFHGQELLLIRKSSWGGRYNALGGHIEPGEDILTSAQRELKEETGILPAKINFCGNIMIDNGNKLGISIFLFKAFSKTKDFQNSDEGELLWVGVNQLWQIDTFSDLPALTDKLLGWRPCDEPILIHYDKEVTYD